MIKVGDRVWVRISRQKDKWIEGKLIAVEGDIRKVGLSTGEELSLPFDLVSHFANRRIQTKQMRMLNREQKQIIRQCQTTVVPTPIVPNLALAFDESYFRDWLAQIEAKLGVSTISTCRYSDKKQRLAVVAALLPPDLIPDKSALSWRETALIGDALWLSYLRITLVGRGYRNGMVTEMIINKKLESREKLAIVCKELELHSLLPIKWGTLNEGETAEAFLGWVYTFGGEKAWVQLAQKYLEILEKEESNDKEIPQDRLPAWSLL